MLAAQLLDPALLSRVVATAAIVIGIALAVERLGPRIGGALAGLPIVIGPGFFFILAERDPSFAAEAAAYALVSLSATEMFLLGYCAAARRLGPAPSVTLAALAWLASAVVLSGLPPSPTAGVLLFAGAALAARLATRLLLRADTPQRVRGGAMLLLVRGLAAGVLVAVVTIAAGQLGTAWSGILIAYPVGFTVVAVTLQQRSGREVTIATLHSATLGVASLAAFSFTLAAGVVPLGPGLAFVAALAASAAVTTFLARWRRPR